MIYYKFKWSILFFIILICNQVEAQNVEIELPVSVGQNGSPHPSALLDVNSLEKGVLLPRMSTDQRDAIPNPAIGLIVYTTEDNCLNIHGSAGWYKSCCELGEDEITDLTINSLGNSIVISFTTPPNINEFRVIIENDTFTFPSSPLLINNLTPGTYDGVIEYFSSKCGLVMVAFEGVEVGVSGITGVGSFENPGKDCHDIRQQNPTAPDGLYYVDPDGANGRGAFVCYCDMTIDGGGWASIFYAEETIDTAGASECFYNFSLNDHDNTVLWNDLSLKLARNFVSSVNGTDWYTWERDGTPATALEPLPDVPLGLGFNGKPVPLPGMLSTVWFDPDNGRIIWEGNDFSFASLSLNLVSSFTNENVLYFFSDGINQIHVGNFSDANAVLLSFDFENMTVSSQIVPVFSPGSTFNTQNDVFGNVLWTVNGRPFYYGGNFLFFNVGSIGNPSAGSGSFFTIPGAISNTQFGLDFFGRVDLTGSLWLADWGHDNGGYFGCGNDNMLGAVKTNIHITDLGIGY